MGLSAQREALEEWRASWVTESRRGEWTQKRYPDPDHACPPKRAVAHYADSFRLGHLGLIYFHYSQIVLRLQYLRIAPAQEAWSSRREAVEHASLLVDYAAHAMPTDVYQYAHNNAFTMISCGAAITLHVRVFGNANAILRDLTNARESGEEPR
jgi:hypothetical protein